MTSIRPLVPPALGLLALAGAPAGQTLDADVSAIALSTGGTQTLTLQTSPPGVRAYLLLGTAAGTSPGLLLDGVVPLPLNPDSYFSHTLANPNAPPLSQSFGLTNAAGAGQATVTVPPGLGAAFVGLTLHHAFVQLDPTTGAVEGASNAESLLLVDPPMPSFTVSPNAAKSGDVIRLTAVNGIDFGDDPVDLCVVGVRQTQHPGLKSPWVSFEPIAANGDTVDVLVPFVKDHHVGVPLKIMVATGAGIVHPPSFFSHPIVSLAGDSTVWAPTADTVEAMALDPFVITKVPQIQAGPGCCDGTPDEIIEGEVIDGKWTITLEEFYPAGTCLRTKPRFHTTDPGESAICTVIKRDAILGCLPIDIDSSPLLIASFLSPFIEDLIQADPTPGEPMDVELQCTFVFLGGNAVRLEFEYSDPPNACPMDDAKGNLELHVFLP